MVATLNVATVTAHAPTPTIPNKSRQTAGRTNFNKTMLWVTLFACGERKKMCVWCLSLCGQQLWKKKKKSPPELKEKREWIRLNSKSLSSSDDTYKGKFGMDWIFFFFLNISILVQHWKQNCNRWRANRYRSKREREWCQKSWGGETHYIHLI